MHLSETCDDDAPQLITNVETTPATTNDVCLTETIHAHLAARALLPAEHLLDSGYLAAETLVRSPQTYGVTPVGPVLGATSWQAQQPDGLDVRCFALDWDAQKAICPAGQVSTRWTAQRDDQGRGQETIVIQFDAQACHACPLRPRCTQAKTGPRTLKVRPRDPHEALQTARQRQTTEAFRQLYAKRAGVEGTLSQGVRAFGLRVARYRGQAKTHVPHILTAVAINIVRVVAWLQERTRAKTRQSPFARLIAPLC